MSNHERVQGAGDLEGLAAVLQAQTQQEEVIERRVEARVAAYEERREQSEFQKLLTASQSQAVQPVTIKGAPIEEWFVTKLSADDVRDMGVQLGRMNITKAKLTTPEGVRATKICLLFVGVVKGRSFPEQDLNLCDDTTRLFESPEQAETLFTAKGWAEAPQLLIEQILRLNPHLSKEVDDEKKDHGG